MARVTAPDSISHVLNGQKSGLQFQTASIGAGFGAMPTATSILVAPTLGGDPGMTCWLRDIVAPAANAKILSESDLQLSLHQFNASPWFYRLLLAGFQAAFARRLDEQCGQIHSPLIPALKRNTVPMGHLEVMGTINSVMSDRAGLSKLINAVNAQSGRVYKQVDGQLSALLPKTRRLGQYALEQRGIRYLLLSQYHQPQALGDVSRYPHRVAMTCALLDTHTGHLDFFARSQTRAAHIHAPPYILLGTMMRQLFESRVLTAKLH